MRYAIVVVLCFASAGCETMGGAETANLFNGELYRVDMPWHDSRVGERRPSEMSKPAIDLAGYCFPEDWGKTGEAEACQMIAYKRAQTSAIHRDRLQDVLIAASNEECDRHKSRVIGTQSMTNLGLSFVGSVLSGAATGFTATSTKTWLAALSTLASSTRSQINDEVYRQLFVGSVITSIDDQRQAQLLEIMSRRRYPVPKDEWDPRHQGRPLKTSSKGQSGSDGEGPLKTSSNGQSGNDGGERNLGDADAQPTGDPAGSAAEITMDDSTVEEDSLSPAPSVEVEERKDGLPERGQADLRQFYGLDEAIRDAAAYHSGCSFYNGLVQLSTTVEQLSPCRLLQERRERLLAEIAAIDGSGARTESVFGERRSTYKDEIESINTKLASCSPGAGG